ncbi:MAG TPA: chemotaxis protein CheW [Bacteroidales bacterium]|nr:chemotaxis protein CheW [Bacteroidales bacterium]
MTQTKDKNEKVAAGEDAFILFDVAGTSYGIRSIDVQQMEMVENITPVPNTPAYVEGVMFSRGEAIPVINLRSRFGIEKIEYNIKTRVIVVRNEERTAGLIADAAREYVYLPAGSVQPLPEYISASRATWLEGIAKTEDRTILIFNVREFLRSEYKEVQV